MFGDRKWINFYNWATKFNHKNLDNKWEDNDAKEVKIIKETSENIIFVRLDFSAVNFIEYLHHNEGLEENSVMSSFLSWFSIIIKLSIKFVLISTNILSSIKNSKDNTKLVKTLTKNISPHNRSNNWFLSRVWWHLQ